MDLQIDRAVPVPIAAQIKGQIEYGISYGLLEPGSKLPNVRDFAKKLKVSPATVSQAYQDLQEQGIIVSAPGRGTYVSENPPATVKSSDGLAALDLSISQLILQAREVGLSKTDLLHKISHHLNGHEHRQSVAVAFIGEFAPASAAYTRTLRTYLEPQDDIQTFTFGDLNRHPAGLEALSNFDLLLTIAHKVGELKSMAPGNAEILGIRFIPSEETRLALAKIDPLARVGLVSTFSEFLAVLKSGVSSYAPHVTIADTAVLGTKRAEELASSCDVVIYASGAEKSVDALGSSVVATEYLHTPDPAYLVKTLVPFIAKLRSAQPAPLHT